MSEGHSLINLGDISKPATVLIEKISNAVGILYEPRKIKNLAKANAEAEKIKFLGQLELSDLELRSINRFVTQEAKKQQNIESITAQAIQELPCDSNTEALEEDWITHFSLNVKMCLIRKCSHYGLSCCPMRLTPQEPSPSERLILLHLWIRGMQKCSRIFASLYGFMATTFR